MWKFGSLATEFLAGSNANDLEFLRVRTSDTQYHQLIADKDGIRLDTINGSTNTTRWQAALKSDLMWKHLSSVGASGNDGQEISYESVNPNELMISYGRKNGTQSYGGGTVIINRFENKPCYLPVYEADGFKGVAYIWNDTGKNRIGIQCKQMEVSNTELWFRVWYR